MKTDVAVIGGGPAGLAAALKASEQAKVMLLERENELGGILPQCIHNGFGNFIFKKMLTGPEYAHHFMGKVEKSDIDVKTETAVLEINEDKTIVATNPSDGILEIKAKAIVLAMGCRERSRAQILIPGTRPAGVYTAGTAQRLINIEGVMPGKRIVILGSGDVGLIMARRFILEGAEVEGVYEIMQKPGGLTRNVVQCLEDYGIPLLLSHTVTNIKGKKRVEAVTVAKVDKSMKPIKGTERVIPCDCLILAVGLIPENELSKQAGVVMDEKTGGPVVDEHMETSVPGIFACGNVVHVHDLVDDVTMVSEIAGEYAAKYATGEIERGKEIKVVVGDNVRYVVPQFLRSIDMDNVTFYFRVKEEDKNVKVIISESMAIFEKKERIVKPPEMVKASVPSELLKGIQNELRIDVRGKYEK
ncbi:MAG: NAD(P)/FAD-dependent oxidoreductase [Candidatus Thermoplasmatota archaeon]|nr:NAD(P)/FAD-dependent oxidoreductase [Candidatus Thermoplasmatota archaeon]